MQLLMQIQWSSFFFAWKVMYSFLIIILNSSKILNMMNKREIVAAGEFKWSKFLYFVNYCIIFCYYKFLKWRKSFAFQTGKIIWHQDFRMFFKIIRRPLNLNFSVFNLLDLIRGIHYPYPCCFFSKSWFSFFGYYFFLTHVHIIKFPNNGINNFFEIYSLIRLHENTKYTYTRSIKWWRRLSQGEMNYLQNIVHCT